MITVALWVQLTAKKGKEQEVADFLKSALPLVQAEPETMTWYAIRLSETMFGIFDTFPAEAGRQAHLAGKVAEALMAHAADLFDTPPVISKVDVLAFK